MEPSENDTKSLATWLDRTYTRYLKALQDTACDVDEHGQARSDASISLAPFLPVEFNACFLHSAYKQHAPELIGEFYSALEIIYDFKAHAILTSNLVIQSPGKLIHVTPVAVSDMQLAAGGILGKASSAATLDPDTLNALLEAVRKATTTGKPAGTKSSPLAIDLVRVIDARMFEGFIDSSFSTAKPALASLSAIAKHISSFISACSEGEIRNHPVQDKITGFIKVVSNALKSCSIDDLARAGSAFMPAGSAILGFHTADALTLFRVVKKSDSISIQLVPVAPYVEAFPVCSETFDKVARVMKARENVDGVCFFSISGLIDVFINFMDGVISGEHDADGRRLMQVLAEMLLRYIRDIRQTWQAYPKLILARLFHRFLLRFRRLRFDLPRIMPDRSAKVGLKFVADTLGENFSLVICTQSKVEGKGKLFAVEISVEKMVPRVIKGIDPALLSMIAVDGNDVPAIAASLHEKLQVAVPCNNQFVIVLATGFSNAISSFLRSLFAPVTIYAFSVLGIFKALKSKKKFGMYPVPPKIQGFLSMKAVDLARKVSRAMFLRY